MFVRRPLPATGGAFVISGGFLRERLTFAVELVHDAPAHHEAHALQSFHVLQWTAVDGNDFRILAGFHYRFSTEVGQDMGRKIATHVARSIMQPTSVAEAR